MDSKVITQIRPIKEAAEDDLLTLPNVVGVDIGTKRVKGKDTGEPTIIVLVSNKTRVSGAGAVPTRIQGVKTDVVERVYVLAGSNLISGNPELAALTLPDTGKYDPLMGGISFGPCRSSQLGGTMGAIVTDRTTGSPMMLTNMHVVNEDSGGAAGDTQAQPALADGGKCPRDLAGSLLRFVLSENVDGAVASIVGRSFKKEIVDVGGTNGSTAATVAMLVRKRGRTSGVTFGKVHSVDLTVATVFPDPIKTRIFKRQVGIQTETPGTPIGMKGDSGAVVVNNARQVVGLYFMNQDPSGFFGAANPIAAVLSELNITI